MVKIKNEDELCCARAIVTMQAWCDKDDNVNGKNNYNKMKLIKSVVSFKYDSCLTTIGCKSELTKLEIRSVGPLLPETIDLSIGIFLCILVST